MNEKIRVVVDYTTPTRERRPTTIEDIYDDFKVLEFNSKEELADELARMNGYENLEEFKQELIDEGDDLDDYDFEGDELDKVCQYFLSSMTDPGDGSPNIQYISINDKPAYEDYWMTYDSLSDNMELLARGSEEDIVKYFLKYEYDYVEDEDDSEDDEELEESFKSMDKKGLYEAVKDIKEDVNTIYKVTSVIFPDEEETEEFEVEEDAMNYAQEQISSGNYDEVIVSEVTIDEDGYEDETILLDEQGESKSNFCYALHTFYEDEPDEIDIDSLETFKTEGEAMKRAKELEAKGLRVVINIEGDESAGWDPEEYEYSDIGDEIYSTPYIMEETFFKSKDKYSVLREALDRLDEEDYKGKKIKTRAQIRNLRSKLKESFKIRRFPTVNGGKKIQLDSDYSVFPINGGSEYGTESMWDILVSEAKDIIEKENIKYYTISKYIQPNYGILKLNLRTFPSQEAKEAWESRKHGFEEVIKETFDKN